MKTKHIKITNRIAKQLRCILAASITGLLPALVLLLSIQSSHADSGTWIGNFDGNWNNLLNWSPSPEPNGSADTATFAASGVTDVFLSQITEVNGIVFNAGAQEFTITVPPDIPTDTNLTLTISGAGITNNSGVTQTFMTTGDPLGGHGVISFTNSATAGNLTDFTNSGEIFFADSATAGDAAITNNGAAVSGESGGATQFSGTSTAGNATLSANGGSGQSTFGLSGGTISFFDTSSAGNATLSANGGSGVDNSGGTISFFDTSSAGNATLSANGGSSGGGGGTISFFDTSNAGNATLSANGGTISFFDTSNAGNATLSANGGTISFFDTSNAGNATLSANGGTISFQGTSTAANATITNNGGFVGIAFFPGGKTTFQDTSTAGNATLIANGGSGIFGVGGAISFEGESTGGAARVEVFGNGNLDIRLHTAPGVSVGSIEGNGFVLLGANNLTVGSNNLSTLFSGIILDGVPPLGGSLTKVGTGTLALTGANTYTGATTVNDGELIVNGSIRSAQTLVNAGGLLGGQGTLRGSLTNGGIVSPGNSPGTLTVSRSYTQNANGTLQIEVAATARGQFDRLAVGGHASLAGTLRLIPLNNFELQVGDKITFLTAGGGVSGTFRTIQNPFISNTLVKAQINILANAVQLEGTQGSFTEVSCNPNALAVAKALDSAVGDPRAAELIDFLDTEPLSELCDDLNLISPEELASIFNIGVSLANIQAVNLERRMDDIRAGSRGFSASGFAINGSTPNFSGGLAGPTGPQGKSGPSVFQPIPENRWGVFVTGLGEFTDVDSTSNARGYDLTTGGFTLGVDYRVGSNFAIGLTGGYAHTNAELADDGNLEVDGGNIGLYATAFGGGFYVNAAATGGFNNYDTERTALLGTARGSTDGAEFTALLASGYDWKIGGLSIGPVANFQYTYVDFDGFTESGSLAPLKFPSQNADSTRTSVGLKTSYDWKVGSVVVKPEIRAAWQHEFGDSAYSIVSGFANGAGSSFTVNGPAIGRDSLLIGAGAAVIFNDRVSVYAYYDGELARTNYSSNNVSAGVRISF